MSLFSFSQITFEKTYGGAIGEQGWEVIQLSDSSFCVAGFTNSYGEPNGDFYLLKADKFGNLEWMETYGGPETEYCYAFTNTFDNGYLLAGTTLSYGTGLLDDYIIKVDSTGTFEWHKYYGGTEVDKLRDVIQSVDTFYYFLGGTTSFGAGGEDIQILKTNIVGDTIWTKTYGDTLNDWANCIIQAPDSNLLFAGWTNNYGANLGDVLLIKIDTAGNVIWLKTYGGLYLDRGNNVINTFDGGYMIAGNTQSSTFGTANKLYLIKTDNLGDTIWTKAYNNHYFVNCSYIEQTLDSGYIITGNENISGTNPDLYLFKVDKDGNEEWNVTYGGPNLDYGLCVKQTFDEGFIVSGTNSSIGAGSEDIYLIKTTKLGTVTGMQPEYSINSIKIYPNPTTGKIRVEAEGMESIEVFDIYGKILKGFENHEGLTEIDLSHQPKGIYIIKVTTSNGVAVEKVILE